MEWERIRKRPEDYVGANLLDYEAYARAFSWTRTRALLDGLPGGGLNIAHEALDRHVLAGRGDKLALRWIGRDEKIRDFSYAALRAQANRFANILAQHGIAKGDRVFSLLGRVPELYVAALGTLKNGSVFSPLFSAFGPEPIKARRLLIGALAVKSVALTVRRFPALNGFYRDGKFEPAAAVHVGVAIAIRGGGLVAPALRDADRLSLDELMTRMRDLVQRVRAGRIRSSEMSDPTITVSSLGERGVEALYGIIYPPQVAIVGFGKVHNAAVGRRRCHRAALNRSRSRSPPTIGSATDTPARCFWRKSAISCRNRTSYDRHSQRGAGRTQ